MPRIVSKIANVLDNQSKTFSKIPQQLLNEANDRISLVELISQTVSLSQVSKDQWKGLCPMHNEKTPSFLVNETKGFFHCFGCGESGNAISFLMKSQGMNFRQAANRVLQLAGMEFYDSFDWIQGESTVIRNSVDKTIKEQEIESDNYLGDIHKVLFHISETCHGVVENNPNLFDKIEEIYLMIDDNYRFKNYSRIDNICHNLLKTIKELNRSKE